MRHELLEDFDPLSDDSSDISHYMARGPQAGLHGGRVWIRSIKLYSDGALGSRGAALLALGVPVYLWGPRRSAVEAR